LFILAKKAKLSKKDEDYKKLAKYALEAINKQDKREPEYV